MPSSGAFEDQDTSVEHRSCMRDRGDFEGRWFDFTLPADDVERIAALVSSPASAARVEPVIAP